MAEVDSQYQTGGHALSQHVPATDGLSDGTNTESEQSAEHDVAKHAYNPEAYLNIDTFRRYIQWCAAHEVSDNAPKPQESTENHVSTKPGSNVNSQPAIEEASLAQGLPLTPKPAVTNPQPQPMEETEQGGEIGLQDLIGKESPKRTPGLHSTHSTAHKDRLSPTTSKSALTAEKLTSASPESSDKR